MPAEPPGSLGRPIDYALSSAGLTDGNRVELLVGGEAAYPAMLGAIAAARREVLLESYIIAADDTGREFHAALIAAARRGCAVRVLCDGVGSFGLPASWFVELERAGAQAVVYRPVAPWRPRWGWWRRDHRKILVVDEAVGFLGGLNLGDDYDSRRPSGRRWRDLHLRLAGPAVGALAHLFARTWNAEVPRAARILWRRPEIVPHPDGVPVAIVGNLQTRLRTNIRRAFLHAVRLARSSVYIGNAYFVPDPAVIRALRRAVRAGCDVRVVVPARSDIRTIDLAARAAFPRLLRAGVRIAEWPGMWHAKAAAVDRAWATVGSYNLDRRSLRFNLEVTANLFDATIAATVADRLRADFDVGRELRLEDLARRPLLDRLLSRLAYQVRSLL